MGKIKGFFAYQSYPESLVETIEAATAKINQTGVVEIKTWKELGVTGKVIINKILEEIDASELFLCDLTYLNFNVLFELGYAIAKNKKIWIIMDGTLSSAKKDYDRLRMLTTVGYSQYTNSQSILENFLKEKPYENLESTLKNDLSSLSEQKSLLYLKSPIDTEASNRLTVMVKQSIVPTVIDDPSEGTSQPLDWYFKQLSNSYGLIAHFLAENQTNFQVLNAKNSFISGIAKGLDLPILLLGHFPFNPPIDYRDNFKVHSTAQECQQFTKDWLENITEEYEKNKKKYNLHIREKKALGVLQSLFVGEVIAEHESDRLVEYFVETREYREALSSQQTLFIGRKGTGKTANLLKISNDLSKDKRNFVCVLTPVGHEIEGVLEMLKKYSDKSEKGYLVESIWKFLIYTELAKALYRKLLVRPHHIPMIANEQEFFDYVETNKKYVDADFTLRLENVSKSLLLLHDCSTIEEQRVKVSEILHSELINNLRKLLGNLLSDKNKVCILIDNLDATWTNRHDLKELGDLLFGLLNVSKQISEQFHGSDYRYKSVNLSVIIFLRSDIFSQILTFANERDKLQHSKLTWADPELLFRVIENRFKYSADKITSPDELWEKYFCEYVNGVPLKTYVSNLIIPRPRDIIYLFRAAIQEAVNRGHSVVEEEDFLSAERKYSSYALDSILAENGNRVIELEELFYEFAGSNSILNKEEIIEIFDAIGISNHDEVIDFLCDLTFLGLETSPDNFEYFNESRSKKIIYKLAERTVAARNANSQRFKINNAFHKYLEINNVEMMASKG